MEAYGDIIKAASINVRGLRDPVNREETITQMKQNGVDIMCLQETKIPDPCYKVRKEYNSHPQVLRGNTGE